jgi:hypothetical protein
MQEPFVSAKHSTKLAKMTFASGVPIFESVNIHNIL